MRVSLFHNQKAGDNTSLSRIQTTIESAGHEIVRVFDREAAFGEVGADRADLVVAAGGDGTVSAAARLMAGRSTPLAVLPIGTANNIARTLLGSVSIEQLVARWANAGRRKVDLGVARGSQGDRRFLEAVGVGLIPAGIASVEASPPDAVDAASELSCAVARYRDVLSRLEPGSWTLDVDGMPRTDDYLLIEVLNTPVVGPNLVLAAEADPSDGYFSVVTAGREHRASLSSYIEDRITGRDTTLALPVVRAREVHLRGEGDAHIDDEVARLTLSDSMSIEIERAAVEFLV